MRIDSVKIKNFKILQNIDINLKNLTLISGLNSAGKSSFIQSLLLLKQNQDNLKTTSGLIYVQKLMSKYSVGQELDSAMKETYDLVIRQQNKLVLNGKYVQLGGIKDILSQAIYCEHISIELGIEDGLYKVSCDSKELRVNIETDLLSEEKINLFAEDFQYISADRISPNITYPLSEAEIKKDLIGLRGEYTAHYLDENRRKNIAIEELRHENAKTNQLLENVSLWLSEISAGIEVLVKNYSELQQASLTYRYTYGDNTTSEYVPVNVGFGITYVLPIIVGILKSKSGDLLIIENPESHLHPAGQSKIAQLCSIAASCGVQIIVETHSDHFLNGVRVATKKGVIRPEDSQIYFFEKDDLTMSAKVSKLNIDRDGRIDDWPINFFDEWEKQLDELLW